MRGNIRVFVRVRPSNKSDNEDKKKSVVTVTKEGDLMVDVEAGFSEEEKMKVKSSGRNTSPKIYEFDHVFGEKSTQDDVFHEAQSLVRSVMDGFHASILAYGQTGSGKTYTMEGIPGQEGVNVRALNDLFKLKEEKEASGIETVQVSIVMVEIYNETVRDLLNSNSDAEACGIRQRPALEGGGVFLPTATVIEVNSIADVDQAMLTGKANRSTGSTKANQHSSRSHSIVMVDVKVKNLATGLVCSGRLSLVDLAGSERIEKTGATGQALTEAKHINSSLSTLGNVISSLKAKQEGAKTKGHVPFRDSKLTYLLQDSLGEGNKTLLIVQVSPESSDNSETGCSITFGSRARNVELGGGSVNSNGGNVNGGGSSSKNKTNASTKAQVEALVSKANKDKAVLEAKLIQAEIKNKNLEKKLEEEKQQLISALATVKSNKLEISQLNEKNSKKNKTQQNESANKRAEQQMKTLTLQMKKMEEENGQLSDFKKKATLQMKKMEEEISEMKLAAKKEAMKLKKANMNNVPVNNVPIVSNTVAPTSSARTVITSSSDPIVSKVTSQTPKKSSLTSVQETSPVTFAEVAKSPPKANENQENNGSKPRKVSFLSPVPSPLGVSSIQENNIVSYRTTPHKEKPSLQEATVSIMKSSLAKNKESNTSHHTSSSGPTRVTVVDRKKSALSNGAQRVSMGGGGGGGGGSSRRSSMASSGSRWH